jgi:hypothetical protein
VIGDAEDVEAVSPVEIDELGKRQIPVAPGGVCMQLAEQTTRRPSSLPVLPDKTGTWGSMLRQTGVEAVKTQTAPVAAPRPSCDPAMRPDSPPRHRARAVFRLGEAAWGDAW